MVMRGPGIAPSSLFKLPASNVDVAPTMLGLAGADELALEMDGRSVVPLVVDPSDVLVPPSTLEHIIRATTRTQGHQYISDRRDGAGASSSSDSANDDTEVQSEAMFKPSAAR